MRKLVVSFCMMVMTLSLSTTLMAQKYGHLNAGNLLQELPAVKAANAELETYQKQLVGKGEEMAKAFQTKLQAYLTKAEGGELSKVQMQQQETGLQSERESIMKYEQEVINKVQVKRQALLEPILKKVDEAIQAVGKENGYQMIFDTSVMNAILFVKDSDDVTSLVKKKLGLQ
ncbi:MAG: OmpH family outer membrane protein [Bacteroidota bacterium]